MKVEHNLEEVKTVKNSVGISATQTEVLGTNRRRLSASYKLKILARLDAAQGRGEVGKILRSERLYSSQVSKWRRDRESGALHSASKNSQRSNAAKPSEGAKMRALLKETAKLQKQLKTANAIIEVQKKVLKLFKELDATDNDGEK